MPIRAALLAYDDFALYSLSHISGLLVVANRANAALGNPHEPFSWEVVSPGRRTVRSGTGPRVLSDSRMGSQIFDIVFVSSFYNLGAERLNELLVRLAPMCAWLNQQWAGGATLVAFGSGTLWLAEAGLLNGRNATTVHWLQAEVRTRYPKVHWQKNVIMTEAARLLCGASFSSDLPLLQRVISLYMSKRVSSQCAQLLLQQVGLSADSPQLTTYLDVNHRDPALSKVDQWLSKNLHRSPSLDKLANAVGVSVRSLHRLFRRELSTAPADYVLQRRMEAACRLLEGTHKSLYEIGRAVGYSDASVFGRAFRKRLGVTPAAYRARYLGSVMRTF